MLVGVLSILQITIFTMDLWVLGMSSGLEIMQCPLSTLFRTVIKDERDLFDTQSASLGKVQVGDKGDKEVQCDVNGIVPPLHRGEGDWVDELIERVSEVYHQLGRQEGLTIEGDVQSQSLGPQVIRHKLGDVGIIQCDPS